MKRDHSKINSHQNSINYGLRQLTLVESLGYIAPKNRPPLLDLQLTQAIKPEDYFEILEKKGPSAFEKIQQATNFIPAPRCTFPRKKEAKVLVIYPSTSSPPSRNPKWKYHAIKSLPRAEYEESRTVVDLDGDIVLFMPGNYAGFFFDVTRNAEIIGIYLPFPSIALFTF
jgi:hypothetical protein